MTALNARQAQKRDNEPKFSGQNCFLVEAKEKRSKDRSNDVIPK